MPARAYEMVVSSASTSHTKGQSSPFNPSPHTDSPARALAVFLDGDVVTDRSGDTDKIGA